MTYKPSSLAWIRFNSSPLLRASKPSQIRAFAAFLLGHDLHPKSLNDLSPCDLERLLKLLEQSSNATLEQWYLEFIAGKSKS